MHLQRLTLTNFKNYSLQTLDFSEKINCLVGWNGMGKTNLLDAIYYLCMCRSSFNLVDGDLMLTGEDFFRLDGSFQRHESTERIVIKAPKRKKKTVERNQVAYRTLGEHIGLLPVVMVSPDDTLLIREGSEERRRFLDNTLSQMDNAYLQQLITYNKILDQRNALLKKVEKEGVVLDLALLQIYDNQLLIPTQYIFEKRNSFLNDFNPIFQTYYQKIAEGSPETVSLYYQSQLHEQTMSEILTERRAKDILLARSTGGIHRDDLLFGMREVTIKKFGSQGQQKSFILALRLAQYELLRQAKQQSKPILLLDDIFDKLDEKRVLNLLKLLVEQSFGQMFITDTHLDRLQQIVQSLGIDYQILRVENGKVEAI